MSSLRQELAAILMDYTSSIPEHIYMEILDRLGKIPDHKDPMKAEELMSELKKERENCSMLEDEKEFLIEEIQEEQNYSEFLEKRVKILSNILGYPCHNYRKKFIEKDSSDSDSVSDSESDSDKEDENYDDMDWKCPYCSFVNEASSDICYVCSGSLGLSDFESVFYYPFIKKIKNNNFVMCKPYLIITSEEDRIEYQNMLLDQYVKNNNYNIHSECIKLLLHENEGWYDPNRYNNFEIKYRYDCIHKSLVSKTRMKFYVRNNRYSIIQHIH